MFKRAHFKLCATNHRVVRAHALDQPAVLIVALVTATGYNMGIQELAMTKVPIAQDVANRIRNSEGPIVLVDEEGQTIGVVRRPPTEAEIERARQRASHGTQRLSWEQVKTMVRREVGE